MNIFHKTLNNITLVPTLQRGNAYFDALVSRSKTPNNIDESKLIAILLLIVIIAYGMLARWTVVEHTIVDHPIRADALQYFLYAKNLATFSTYSRDRTSEDGLQKDAFAPPGFPFFASLFYQGDNMNSVTPVLKTQTVLQCITFLILTILCWWLFGAWASVAISLLIWTHPAFMSINTYYLTESIFTSSLVIVIALFSLVLKNPSSRSLLILLGISVAISALIRPTMEFYFLFLLLLILLRFRYYFQHILLAIVVFILIVFSWKLRNYFAIGSFSDPKLMISSLYHGSFPNFMYNNLPESYGFPYRFDPMVNQYYEGVGKTLQLIWQRVIEQPLQYIYWYLAGKQLYLWQWDILAGAGDVFIYPVISSPIKYQADLQFWNNLHHILNAPIMLIGVLYSYFIVAKNMIKKIPIDIKFIIASLIVYASLFHVIVAPFPRYGIPFKVLVIIIFVLFIQSAIVQIKTKIMN